MTLQINGYSRSKFDETHRLDITFARTIRPLGDDMTQRTKTISARDFCKDVAAAIGEAADGVHVVISDDGQPVLALISMSEYQRLSNSGTDLVKSLRMSEDGASDFEFEKIRISARSIAPP